MLIQTQGRTPTFGEIATQLLGKARGEPRRRGGLHITKQPVHGGSKEAGSVHEEAFMVRLDDATRRGCWRAVNVAFERGRRAMVEARREKRELTKLEYLCSRITGSTIRVYDALLRMEKAFRGQVFPSYETIADWAHVSRATAHRALKALEAIGLLERLRRYVCTQDATIGARSEQTSNAYRMQLPRILRELIEKRHRPAPLPDDELHRQHERLADHAAMLARLSKRDYIRETTPDAGLAAALIRLDEAIERRDQTVAHP